MIVNVPMTVKNEASTKQDSPFEKTKNIKGNIQGTTSHSVGDIKTSCKKRDDVLDICEDTLVVRARYENFGKQSRL